MGRLIAIEGIDGSGKGTQTALLEEYLRGRGLPVRKISFPNYESESSAPLRMYLGGQISPDPGAVGAYAASSFFAVDRYISFKQDWERDYREGKILLADRYVTSNITHQMTKLPKAEWQNFAGWLCDYEYVRLGMPKPDLVVYLDMHPAVSQKLLLRRYQGDEGKRDIHEGNTEYLTRCREAALYAAKGLHWEVVRCFDEAALTPLPVEDIARQVRALTAAVLG
ncbi:MAG: thymidylate kinase [Clostridiales bacterium]|uniref:Thymidylate kinase n=1 Tax=Harryflintia acetispora TaxID=1849041 RepID=A0A9X8Y7V7_9FIRM|nr:MULTISPECIES: thymidylate kinase [Oscillospiraceae]PWM38049.1 MAG: thymidylate kinase [Clostridiales bacterium]RGB65141.1 thymidylate kinase [Harryflintia acetispora]TCL42799.1 dTMP kinase [Harryflintia acetispora]